MADALAARGISFAFSGPDLFRDFSLVLDEGAFVALVGPNGSGKTTLLRLLSGSLSPRAGRVELFGEPMSRVPARRRARSVSVVPQESRVLYPFTVLEVVLMGRFPHLSRFGMETGEDAALARKCLAEVGMETAESRPLNRLSSGERQRVLIARALAQEARILLLDEPTSFLDLKHRLQIYEILRRLNRESGLTVLAVSHDLNLAARYCQRICLLHSGALWGDGAPRSVLEPIRIGAAYGIELEIGTDPRSGTPFVIPYPKTDTGGGS